MRFWTAVGLLVAAWLLPALIAWMVSDKRTWWKRQTEDR